MNRRDPEPRRPARGAILFHTSFRAGRALLSRIEEAKDFFSTRSHKATRAEVFRVLLEDALDRLDRKRGKKVRK